MKNLAIAVVSFMLGFFLLDLTGLGSKTKPLPTSVTDPQTGTKTPYYEEAGPNPYPYPQPYCVKLTCGPFVTIKGDVVTSDYLDTLSRKDIYFYENQAKKLCSEDGKLWFKMQDYAETIRGTVRHRDKCYWEDAPERSH